MLKHCYRLPITFFKQGYGSVKVIHCDGKVRTEIPDFYKLMAEYSSLAIEERQAINLALNDLLEECNISNVPKSYFERKQILLNSSIDALVERNFIPDLSAVVRGLLSNLEPFTFNDSEIAANKNPLSVKHIRDEIQKQYLAWKFKKSINEINSTFWIFQDYFFKFQSMKNLRRNTNIIEKLSAIYQLNVCEKIYLVQQVPFDTSLIMNFQEKLAGLRWNLFLIYCPQLFKYSYKYILFLIKNLQKMQFSDKQIQEALPFLHARFPQLLRNLNYMLTSPKIVKYRNEEKFLCLISFRKDKLENLFNDEEDSFSEQIKKAIEEKRQRVSYKKEVLRCIRKFLAIDSYSIKKISKPVKCGWVSGEQILDTLAFLKTNGFQEEEIAGSIRIIFYPSELIQRTLAEVEAREFEIERYGFQKSCTLETTNHFSCGIKSKKKTLQLCLYYLEKKFDFELIYKFSKKY